MTLAPSSKGSSGQRHAAPRDTSAATEVLDAVEAQRARTRRLRWTLGIAGLAVAIVAAMLLSRRHDASIRAEARRVSLERATLGTFVTLREASEVIADARTRVGPDVDLARMDRLLQGIRAAEFGDANALERVTATQARGEVGADPLADALERAALGDLEGLREAVRRLDTAPPASGGDAAIRGRPGCGRGRDWLSRCGEARRVRRDRAVTPGGARGPRAPSIGTPPSRCSGFRSSWSIAPATGGAR